MEIQHKQRHKTLLATIAAAAIGAVLTVSAVTESASHFEKADAAVQSKHSSAAYPFSIADIVEETSEAIVGVINIAKVDRPFSRYSDEVQNGTGSGVVYNVTADATYIVTNHHVIEKATEIKVSLSDGEVMQAELVGIDPLTDIAVLKVAGNYDIKPLQFGNSDALRAGDYVIAIGNPLGLELSRSVTHGIISAVDRTIPVNTSMGEWDLNVLQTDAAINPGNSGGALINMDGKVIGINSLKIANNGVEGLGFAIPSNDVKQIIAELTKHGQVIRPYLGVGLAGLDEIHPYYLQLLPHTLTEGAIVVTIDETSPAAKAGLQVEDIIVSIDGKKIKDDDALRKILYTTYSIGDTVVIEYYRKGSFNKVQVKLASNQR